MTYELLSKITDRLSLFGN